MNLTRRIVTLILICACSVPAALEAGDLDAARQQLRGKQYDEASQTLKAIVEQEPQNGPAWALYGSALRLAGRLDAALEAHQHAASFADQEAAALYNIGCIHAVAGRKKQALSSLRKAVATGKIDPIQMTQDPDLASLRGDAAYIKLLPQAASISPTFVEPVRVLHEWSAQAAGDEFGWIARNIGDADGDGIADLTTSAPSFGGNSGRIYTYSGKSGELLWTADGESGQKLGQGIEAAGDVNGDGAGDVIAGSPLAGVALVYSGRDGKLLHRLQSEEAGDNFGRQVSDLGDWNGDGHDDVVVGAPGHDAAGKDAGRVYVFSGKDGSVLRRIDGEKANDNFGSSAAGWVGEKARLLVVGAPNAGPKNTGRVYAFGAEDEARFVIDPDDSGARLGGMFVSVIGDVDADGTPDVYGSDWHDSTHGRATGRIYVHSGKDGSRLLSIGGEAAGDGFGIGPADAGDVNKDGHDDLIVGAWRHSGAAPSGGKAYLYSGADGSLLASFTCRAPGDTFGFDATGMGDVDSDGTLDLLITSAWSFTRGPRAGRMFLVSAELETATKER